MVGPYGRHDSALSVYANGGTNLLVISGIAFKYVLVCHDATRKVTIAIPFSVRQLYGSAQGIGFFSINVHFSSTRVFCWS